jgi:hypothetical protein
MEMAVMAPTSLGSVFLGRPVQPSCTGARRGDYLSGQAMTGKRFVLCPPRSTDRLNCIVALAIGTVREPRVVGYRSDQATLCESRWRCSSTGLGRGPTRTMSSSISTTWATARTVHSPTTSQAPSLMSVGCPL